jgi:hypothetical protein
MNKYQVYKKMRNFEYEHNLLFKMFRSFFTLLSLCAYAIVALLPLLLGAGISAWWFLSALIIWPVGFHSITWLANCLFDLD